MARRLAPGRILRSGRLHAVVGHHVARPCRITSPAGLWCVPLSKITNMPVHSEIKTNSCCTQDRAPPVNTDPASAGGLVLSGAGCAGRIAGTGDQARLSLT